MDEQLHLRKHGMQLHIHVTNLDKRSLRLKFYIYMKLRVSRIDTKLHVECYSGQGACTFHTMACIRASWYAINTVILQYLRLSDDQLFVEKRVRANENK